MQLPVMDERLANRILQSETAFLRSRISSIGERSGNPEGVEIERFGKATAFYVKTMPWPLFNSVKEFSEDDVDLLEEIVRFYGERKRAFQLDVNPVGCSSKLFVRLAETGLCQEGFHTVLYGLPREETPVFPAGIRVREVENEADFDVYAETHCIASGMLPAHKHHFANNNRGLLNRPGWKLFVAYWHDRPAAVAAMHTDGDVASCALAATIPDFRGNGLQTALLLKRMYEARRADCRFVVAQASFGSASQRNLERAGMRVAWTRAVWGPVTQPPK